VKERPFRAAPARQYEGLQPPGLKAIVHARNAGLKVGSFTQDLEFRWIEGNQHQTIREDV